MFFNRKSANGEQAKMKEIIGNILGHINPTIKSMVKQTIGLSTKISAFHTDINHYSENLNQVSIELKDDSESFLSAIEEASASVGEVSSAISDNTIYLGNITNSTDTIAKSINENDDILSEMTVVNKELSNEGKVMKESIDELSGIVSDIKSIVEGINSITANTSILALNASIEAARAGEYGKGFAVVANEVKKLAEDTQGQLSAIESFVNKIEEASSKCQNSVSQSLDSIVKMSDYTNKMTTSFNESKESISEIVSGVQTVSGNMEEVNVIGSNINSTMNVLTEGAQGLANVGSKVYDISNKIGYIGQSLEKLDDDVSSMVKLTNKINSEENFRLTNEEFMAAINNAIETHTAWVDKLNNMARNMQVEAIQLNGEKCGFGHFYSSVKPNNEEILSIWNSIDSIHKKLHSLGNNVINSIKRNDSQGAIRHAKEAETLSKDIIDKFKQIQNVSNKLTMEKKYIF